MMICTCSNFSYLSLLWLKARSFQEHLKLAPHCVCIATRIIDFRCHSYSDSFPLPVMTVLLTNYLHFTEPVLGLQYILSAQGLRTV